MMPIPVLELEDVTVRYGRLAAVEGVSLSVATGESLGIVGESGCGKTSLAKAMVGLVAISSGVMKLDGRPVTGTGRRNLSEKVQLLFQDPVASLSPRMSVGDLMAEPLKIRRLDSREKRDRLIGLAVTLGLPRDIVRHYPHQLSGGQARRVSLIRALAMEPEILIADEPTAGLDLSVQGDVLNLIQTVQREFHLTTLFISHNLNVVGRVTGRVAIMYLGKIVELGRTLDVFSEPAHPYTAALLSANPTLNPQRRRKRIVLKGEQPSPYDPPSGCRFHTRCPIAQPRCRVEEPRLAEVSPARTTACHFPLIASRLPVPSETL